MEFANGQYQVKGAPAKALRLKQIAEMAYGETLAPTLEHGLEGTEFWRPPALVYPFGAHVAVVEVDKETGAVRLLDYVSVDDCGVRISPMLVSGQVHGGLAQGIAQALWEDLRYSDDGQLMTGSLMDYAVPRAEDLPMFRDVGDGHADAAQPAGREGHRGGGDDRVDAGRGERGGRCVARLRHQASGHAAEGVVTHGLELRHRLAVGIAQPPLPRA